MDDMIFEKARELGRLMGQTEEHKALEKAREALSDDRETVTLVNSLGQLEQEISRMLQRGDEPGEDLREKYEGTFGELQGLATYQRLAAAQSNFEKLLVRVNEEIEKGMSAASQSRIILPS